MAYYTFLPSETLRALINMMCFAFTNSGLLNGFVLIFSVILVSLVYTRFVTRVYQTKKDNGKN